jgi:hypothetical protein
MFQMKRIVLILLILSFSVIETFGGGQNRAGTAGAPELRIPVGARYLAMSGAPIANVTGLEAIYWNPAGLDFSPNSANALFSYRSYVADMSISQAAANGRLGDLGSIGISFRSFSIGDINVTTMDQPDGTGGIFSPTYFVLGLTYSKQLTDRIGIGVNLNLINETIDRVSASGFAFDIGVQYRDLLEVPGLHLGVVVKNLGAPIKYSGNGLFYNVTDPTALRGPTYLAVDAASAELPSEMAIGLSYQRKLDEENTISIAGTFQNNNYTYDDYKIGAEYSYKDIFFVRGGYLFSPQSTDAEPNIFSDYTLGLGVNLEKFSGLNIAVDYAYVPVKYFDGNHVLSISLGF